MTKKEIIQQANILQAQLEKLYKYKNSELFNSTSYTTKRAWDHKFKKTKHKIQILLFETISNESDPRKIEEINSHVDKADWFEKINFIKII